MMELTIKAKGFSQDDLVLAVEEALRLLREGYRAGKGDNDSGEFNFFISGEEDAIEMEVA